MAKQRTAGARTFARLAACTFLAFSSLAQADEAPPPFPEYEAHGEFFRDLNLVALRAMQVRCDHFEEHDCQLLSARTSGIGYAYDYQYRRDRPGGDAEWARSSDGGYGYYSCPPGFSVYITAFGMPMGPYANREMDVGGPFPVFCQAAGLASVPAGKRAVTDTYERGTLTQREVSEDGLKVRWTVTPEGAGTRVHGLSRDGMADFLIADDRVVTIGDRATLVYGANGTLRDIQGADGTSIGLQGKYDPEGRLRLLLEAAIAQGPDDESAEPLGAVARAIDAIKALLDKGSNTP